MVVLKVFSSNLLQFLQHHNLLAHLCLQAAFLRDGLLSNGPTMANNTLTVHFDFLMGEFDSCSNIVEL
jgi:hypothetical protein